MNEMRLTPGGCHDSDRLDELITKRAHVSAQIACSDQRLSDAQRQHRNEQMALLFQLVEIDSAIARATAARHRSPRGCLNDTANTVNVASERLKVAICRRSTLQIRLGERSIAARLIRIEARRAADSSRAQQLLAEAIRRDEEVSQLTLQLRNVVGEILDLEAEDVRGR